MAESRVRFTLPEIHDNPNGWGPSSTTDKFSDIPYQPFSKGDRLGKVADWGGNLYSDRKTLNKYSGGYGAGGQMYSYIHEEEDHMFQLVDTNKPQKPRSRPRIGYSKYARNRHDLARKGPQQPQIKRKERRTKHAKFNKYRFYQPQQGPLKSRDPSIEVKSTWSVVEDGEMEFAQLGKLSLPLEEKPKTLVTLGSLGLYKRHFDRVSCKTPQPLRRIDRRHYRVSTTDDPIIKKLAKENPDVNVFATDTIITTLMTCTRSVYSWDIVAQRIGKSHLFFDIREGSKLDLPTVGETAASPPEDESGINSYNSLMAEATYIKQNFSQQVLDTKTPPSTISLEGPNPFQDEEDSNTSLASVAYRYRKWNLGKGIKLIARCELDAYMQTTSGEALVNIKACNEWDAKQANTPEWRAKLDKQRGAVLATEIRNNGFKMAKWTMGALLAGADFIKFGYVSRTNPKDSTQHIILGVQQFQPLELAKQMTLNVNNAWGVLRAIIDTCLKLPPGKYTILKDPNKSVVRIYTHEGESDSESESESEETSTEEGEEDSEEEKR